MKEHSHSSRVAAAQPLKLKIGSTHFLNRENGGKHSSLAFKWNIFFIFKLCSFFLWGSIGAGKKPKSKLGLRVFYYKIENVRNMLKLREKREWTCQVFSGVVQSSWKVKGFPFKNNVESVKLKGVFLSTVCGNYQRYHLIGRHTTWDDHRSLHALAQKSDTKKKFPASNGTQSGIVELSDIIKRQVCRTP